MSDRYLNFNKLIASESNSEIADLRALKGPRGGVTKKGHRKLSLHAFNAGPRKKLRKASLFSLLSWFLLFVSKRTSTLLVLTLLWSC